MRALHRALFSCSLLRRVTEMMAVALVLALSLGACQQSSDKGGAGSQDKAAAVSSGDGSEQPPEAKSSAAPFLDESEEKGVLPTAVGDPAVFNADRESPELLVADGEAEADKPAEGGKKDKTKAEKKTWKRSQITPNTARIDVGDGEFIPLEGMQTRIDVDGFRARVVIDYYFFNDHPRQPEGTFKLRLPSGASPFFLAFGQTAYEEDAPGQQQSVREPRFLLEDEKKALAAIQSDTILQRRERTWNEPKVARMVQREQAAQAYLDTVRRRVDPALLEWSGPGVFSAQIFPITANQLHRVTVGYDVDLLRLDGDAVLTFDLPDVARTNTEVRVRSLEGVGVTLTPETQFAERFGQHIFHVEGLRAQSLEVRLTGLGDALLQASDAAGPFFVADLAPVLPEVPAATNKYAVFALDTSLSSNPDRFNIWLQLMERILTDNRDSIQRFAVLTFNVETHWWRPEFVLNTPENVAALLNDSHRLVLEGATDVGAALAQAAAPEWMYVGGLRPSWDVFVLSDGAATWGESDAFRMTSRVHKAPVFGGSFFAYNTGLSGTNGAFLQHLARETGGAVFSVQGDAEVSAAATAHTKRAWMIDNVIIAGASDIMLSGRPSALYPGQRVRMVGRGPLVQGEPAPTAVFTLSQWGKQITVEASLGHVIDSPLAPRAYGQVAVAQLEELSSATLATSEAYARHFRVTGKSASLLMLETEEDYLRFNIRPQDDAGMVRAKLASIIVTGTLTMIGDALESGRAEFFHLLGRMERTPGIEFSLSKTAWAALREMPEASFDVRVAPLVVKARGVKQISKVFLSRLATREMDYDVFVEEAQRRSRAYGTGDGLKALSSLVEHSPGDSVLARDVAYQAMEWGLDGQAYHLLRRVAAMRPYEPQTYHALAQSLAAMGQADMALAMYEVALGGQWDARFGEFREIVSLDYLHFLRQIERGELETSARDFALKRAEELRGNFGFKEADLLVVIAWNTDNTDVDLHIIEPGGEECYYAHAETRMGGKLTRDVTQGYGPEMYTLPKAKAGVFQVRAKYYASNANRLSARTKVYATVYEDWGRTNERVTRKVVSLEYGKEQHDILKVKR